MSRDESSVLFSLKELKNIESSRVEEEKNRARDAELAVVRAREAEERARLDAEQAAVRARQAEEQRQAEAHERRLREEALRIQEAEAKARVEAQRILDERRQAEELSIQRAAAERKRPIKLIAAGAFALVAMAAVGAGLFYKKSLADKEKARVALLAQQEAEKQMQELDREVERLQGEGEQIGRQVDEAVGAITKAQNDVDRQRAKDQLAALQERQRELAAQQAAARERQRKAGKVNKVKGNDPL